VRIENNRVEFLDVSAGNSTYTIKVHSVDEEGGETVEVSTWVNAEDRENADDVQMSSFTIAANDPAEFEVAINSPIESVTEGKVTEVTAVITNTGDLRGTKEVTLQVCVYPQQITR